MFKLRFIVLFFIICQSLCNEQEFSIKLEKLFNASLIIKDKKTINFNDTVTSYQLINEMGFGWGLGNTLECFKDDIQNMGLSSETIWSNPETSKEIIEQVAKKGFRTIRLAVTWRNHLIDENYTIDPNWMKRIKTIVDWSIDLNLYVILNMHHDEAPFSEEPIEYGKGFYPLERDKEESERFLYNIWGQISLAFNNGYDHHLIFEVMNEPRLRGNKDYEWNYKKGIKIMDEAVECINEYSSLILKTIRESGGNNEKRFVLFPPYSAHYFAAIDSNYQIPDDSDYNPNNIKTLVSVHMYLPYKFTMEDSNKNIEFLESYKDILYGYFKFLYEKFVLRGHHVVIGEMGVINKNNTEERTKWGKYFIETTRKFQMACCIWDNGKLSNALSFKEVHGQLDRRNLKWLFNDLVNTFIKASYTPFQDNPVDIIKNNFLYSPFYFYSWNVNIEFTKENLEGLNPYNKLCFTTADPPFHPDYRRLKINKGDWSGAFNFSSTDVKGANVADIMFLVIQPGLKDVEITLNDTTIDMMTQFGLVLNGYGFALTRFYISGPRLIRIEPIRLTYSNSEEQTIRLYFNEDAVVLANDIKFFNIENDAYVDTTCSVLSSNVRIIICNGIFDYDGEYVVKEKNGHLLSNRPIFFNSIEE